MWSSWSEKAAQATKSMTEAFDSAGEAITQAASKAHVPKKGPMTPTGDDKMEGNISDDDDDILKEDTKTKKTSKPTKSKSTSTNNAPRIPNVDKEKFFKNFQAGWSSVVESTKRTIDETKKVVESNQIKFEQGITQSLQFRKKGFYKRDPTLPLDVQALRDAQVVYITDRIITMSHPAMASTINPTITGERKLAAIGHLLNRRHDGRFLVWNLSEIEYDIDILDDQVLTFSFPGSPSPPLGQLLKLLVSMENWMKADDRNVAVVHCLTGKGRTSTVLAAFLCWMGQAGFGDIQQAMEYIAHCKQMPVQDLIIPSQSRYASYFKNMLDGVRPSQPPLMLKRIIMSEAPKYAKGPKRESVEDGDQTVEEDSEERLMGCAPYLQIFKAGKLVFTTAATLHFHQSQEELPFVQVVDGPVPFNVEQIIQGDILIRCRHLTYQKQRVSMFRSAFHTGYAPPNVMRLTKTQLDGACSDKRFRDDFFLDLIFEKVDAETAAKHFEEEEAADQVGDGDGDGKKADGDEEKSKGPVIKASTYDSMLHGDSRFWDVIAARRQEQASQKESDPMWGPTVGRRRGESKKNIEDGKAEAPKERTQLETFSIGNEFDFLPEEKEKPAAVAEAPQKDDLMDALNALDEGEDAGTEQIVFDTSTKPVKSFTSPQLTVVALAPADGDSSKDDAKPEETTIDATSEAEPAKNADEESTSDKQETTSTDDDLDDMDALLATADEDLGDFDLDEFDDDDDLEDLENMLKT